MYVPTIKLHNLLSRTADLNHVLLDGASPGSESWDFQGRNQQCLLVWSNDWHAKHTFFVE